MIDINIIPLEQYRDILLKVPPLNLDEQLDSYYFRIDHVVTEGKMNYLQNICNILNSWCNILVQLSNKSHCYLPIDFSDQYIGCFRVHRNKDRYTIDYGFTTKIEGHAILPSDSIPFNIDDNAYKQTSLSIERNIDEFIEGLRYTITSIAQVKVD